jgi:hypothetical protein
MPMHPPQTSIVRSACFRGIAPDCSQN